MTRTPTLSVHDSSDGAVRYEGDTPRELTSAEQSLGLDIFDYAFLPGDPLRYGADPNAERDSTAAFQAATNTGHPVMISEGRYLVSGVTSIGRTIWVGKGEKSVLLSDGPVLTVTSGSGSMIDNFALENITAPWIITRDPEAWLEPALIDTLIQSNENGYQPTVNDVDTVNDIWNNLTLDQKNQDIGPVITFTGNASRVLVRRIYGRLVRIDMLDTRYSTVRDCNFRGGKGTWGAINFDNLTNAGQSGIGNKAIDNIVQYASYNGIIFQNNDRPYATGNTVEYCGESGIKPAGGGSRKCIRAIVDGNTCSFNYYDGIDCVTSFPTNSTIPAYHRISNNTTFQNGGNGINADGRYARIQGNLVQTNGRIGIWCTGGDCTIHDNLVIDNNQVRNASYPEILGGGASGCRITDNHIISGGGQNSNAIYYDSAGYIANNFAIGSVFFFGNTPLSYLQGNVDDSIGKQHEQSFVLNVGNVAGTLQHAIFSQSGALSVSTETVNRIASASASLTNTPTGADSSTAFSAGGKIGSASTNRFWFDTADQVIAKAALTANVIYNDVGTAVLVRPQLVSLNINGVTRTRLVFDFVNASTGAAFALTTGNIGSGKTIQVQFYGRLS